MDRTRAVASCVAGSATLLKAMTCGRMDVRLRETTWSGGTTTSAGSGWTRLTPGALSQPFFPPRSAAERDLLSITYDVTDDAEPPRCWNLQLVRLTCHDAQERTDGASGRVDGCRAGSRSRPPVDPDRGIVGSASYTLTYRVTPVG